MKSFSSGFTLIELMIAVAIIGILAAVSVPLYQDYVVSAQVKRALGELSAYKSGVEERLSQGDSTITNSDIGYVPSNLTTGDSVTNITSMGADGSGHFQVTLGGNVSPNVAGTIIRLERTSGGEWSCVFDTTASAATWKNAYLPDGCAG